MTDEELCERLARTPLHFPEGSKAAARIRELVQLAEAMAEALAAWEQWEAELILDNDAWRTGDGCSIPQKRFDAYVEGPQTKRGQALVAWRNR